MRFVPVKSEEPQGGAPRHGARTNGAPWLDLPYPGTSDPAAHTGDQRASRGHLGEFGQIVPQGAGNATRLIAMIEDPESGLPAEALATLDVLVAALRHLETAIGKLDAEISRRAKVNEVARRLMTISGIGP